MRKSLTVVLALLIVSAVASAAGDNTIGTWKFDTAKSVQAPGLSPVKTLTVVRKAASGGGVDTSVKGEREDGSKIETSYTGKYDGKEVNCGQIKVGRFEAIHCLGEDISASRVPQYAPD